MEELQAKRPKRSSSLPREVVFQILHLVPDESTLFALLEAFQGTTIAQGPMEAAWNLGRSIGIGWSKSHCIQHSCLWPHLELFRMKDREWELAIQAAPLFATVMMLARYNLHRLVGRVSPSTNLVVVHYELPDPRRMRKWFAQVAQLPVRGLVYTAASNADRMPGVIPHLVKVWPSLTYLRRLELTVGDQASLEAISKCVATSRLTELLLDGRKEFEVYNVKVVPHIKLEGKVLTNLVAWLRSTSVVRFDLHTFRFNCDSMQALNGALAASDALHRISWTYCAIRISAPLVLPPRLQHLSLSKSAFELVGINCVWNLLPKLPYLTHVTVAGNRMTCSDVDTMANALAQSNVSHLDLNECAFGVDNPYEGCIQRLADAFQAMASLRMLRLEKNELDFDGVKAILAAAERRASVTKTRMVLKRFGDLHDLVKRDELKELAKSLQLRGIRVSLGWY